MKKMFVGIAFSLFLIGSTMAAETTTNGENKKKEENVNSNKDKTKELTVTAEEVKENGEEAYVGYGSKVASSATKIDLPVFDTPASIQVVTKKLIEDQRATSLSDALRNVSGVHDLELNSYMNTADASLMRGFRNGRLYYNGTLAETAGSMTMSNIEKVEVLKGPASMLYGVLEPGGVVSVTTKKPQEESRYHIEQIVGSNDYYVTNVDLTGPLMQNKKLLYRINMSYQNSESFRDYVEEERYMIAPSVEWRPGDKTSVLFEFSHSQQDRPIDEGVSFGPNGSPVSSISTYLGDAELEDPGQSLEDTFASVKLTHNFTDNLKFTSTISYHYWENYMDGIRHSQGNPNADYTVRGFYEDSDFDETSFQFVNELQWKFNLGITKHTALFGIDYRDRDDDITIKRGNAWNINIINPTYGFATSTTNPSTYMQWDRNWVGFYAQDHVELLPDNKLLLLFGGRYDSVETRDYTEGGSDPWNKRTDDEFTGRVGLMAHPVKWLGVYATASQSFVPTGTGAKTYTGTLLDPETGIQYEGGFKFNFLDGNLQASTAIYRLTKEDVAIGDTDHPGFSVNAGKLRSQGFEFDFTGQVAKGFEIIGNYTYTDTKVVESDSLPEGSRFINIPLHSGSIWGKYTLQNGVAKGLGIGAGIYAQSEKFGDNGGSFHLPGYVRFDAGVYYTLKLAGERKLDLQLNAKNLLDEEYYKSSYAATRVFPGSPREVYFSLGFTF